MVAQMCPQRLPLPFFLQNIPSTVVKGKATLLVHCVLSLLLLWFLLAVCRLCALPPSTGMGVIRALCQNHWSI